MKRLRIGFAVICLTLVSSIFMTGCIQEENKEIPEEESVTVSMLVQQSRYFDGLKKMIAKLEEEEQIRIQVQVVPDEESLYLIKMKLNAGEWPDLIDYNVPAIYDIINPEEYFEDLSGEPWVKKLLLPENVTADNGKIYGFPFLSIPGVHGFIYNKDVFAKYNLKTPSDWDELLDVCQTLKEQGVIPVYMPKDSWVPQVLMSDNFAKIFSPEETGKLAEELLTNQKKWTEVLEFSQIIDRYLELYEKGYINENFSSASYKDAIEAVAEGKAAMHFNGDFFATSVKEKNPAANIGMFTLSMLGTNDVMTQNMSSPGFVVPKNSKNLETVKRILELFATPEYANLYFENRPAFPAFSDVDGGEIPEYLSEVYEKYIRKGKVIPEFNYYVMKLNALCESTLYVYYMDAPVKGNMDGKKILEKFQEEYQNYMKGVKAEGF